ncbi:MAG TPA: SAM-dependent methyltransferase [Alphaproteobacteria bacterium]|nr:SAM-dependent methyltransferase [Alphaproteobacteria bacterium]
MPNTLAEIIRRQIESGGPISVEAYWNLCLAHPEHGYYIKKDPLGAGGDFTTAPEISQLFGEMIGVWVAEEWHRLGSSKKLHLVECGPGRGMLMADLLRIAGMIPDFAASLHVHLVETSPSLREKQSAALSFWQKDIIWRESLADLPSDAPIVFIGNEFLDALPIRQYVRSGNDWRERLIGFEDKFLFLLGNKIDAVDMPDAEDGAIFEVSPARQQVIDEMAARIKKQGGAILMIDYGHSKSGVGDTFQAVQKHEFANVLENQGDVDLTSHIDFARLALDILNQEIVVTLCTQDEFLRRVGVMQRAEQLKKNATVKQAEGIDAALHRFLDDDQMGTLFKVLEARS